MQGESADLCSIASRLEKLRLVTQGTWADVAESLGLSESMIYQAKSGKRSLSEKALYSLAKAEIKAGVLPPLLSRIHSRNEETGGSFPIEIFKEAVENDNWSADDEAQLAAILGKDLLGSSLMISWDFLKSHLEAFIKGVNLSITMQRQVSAMLSKVDCDAGEAGGVKDSSGLMVEHSEVLERLLPALEVQIDAFQFGLERFLETSDQSDENSEPE